MGSSWATAWRRRAGTVPGDLRAHECNRASASAAGLTGPAAQATESGITLGPWRPTLTAPSIGSTSALGAASRHAVVKKREPTSEISPHSSARVRDKALYGEIDVKV